MENDKEIWKNKWRARIRIGNTNKHLGLFDNQEDASNAYQRELTNANKLIIG